MAKTKTKDEWQKAEAEIRIHYQSLQGTLTERSRSLFAGCEAFAFGYGGIEAVSRATGLSRVTVCRGLEECQLDATAESSS